MKDERYYQAYLSHNRVSRRGLLRGLFGGAEKAATGAEKHDQTRPPFCAPESLFLAACTGCGECVKACEFGLISLYQGKARLEIDYAACTLCGDCARACPSQALHPSFPADTELRPKFASHCLQHKGQPCTTCATACPQHAIITGNPMTVNNACNGCGECKIACFVNAVGLGL